MVYVPDHEDEKKSMFYLTVDNLICAVDDLNKMIWKVLQM